MRYVAFFTVVYLFFLSICSECRRKSCQKKTHSDYTHKVKGQLLHVEGACRWGYVTYSILSGASELLWPLLPWPYHSLARFPGLSREGRERLENYCVQNLSYISTGNRICRILHAFVLYLPGNALVYKRSRLLLTYYTVLLPSIERQLKATG